MILRDLDNAKSLDQNLRKFIQRIWFADLVAIKVCDADILEEDAAFFEILTFKSALLSTRTIDGQKTSLFQFEHIRFLKIKGENVRFCFLEEDFNHLNNELDLLKTYKI